MGRESAATFSPSEYGVRYRRLWIKKSMAYARWPVSKTNADFRKIPYDFYPVLPKKEVDILAPIHYSMGDQLAYAGDTAVIDKTLYLLALRPLYDVLLQGIDLLYFRLAILIILQWESYYYGTGQIMRGCGGNKCRYRLKIM